jgi:hypothetical protein
MHRLNRPAGDDGAVAVLVALLVSTVLLGMGALVLDVGSLYAERRQLQNGADAGALAVAQDCAAPTGCGTASTTAGKYANTNSNDGTSAVDLICGTAAGLPACPAPQGPWDCQAIPSSLSGLNYVQVQLSTRTSTGGTLLPPILARALPGMSGYSGTNVKACARASWGGLASHTASLSMTLSAWEWSCYTNNGTSFAPSPPYPPNPAASYEHNIFIHTTSEPAPCGVKPAGASGYDLPGGFGWLDDTSGNCTVYVDDTLTYNDKTGVSAPSSCKTALSNAWTSHQLLYIPVYDGVSGTGGNGTYHLAGWAAFVLTGYQIPGAKQNSWLTGKSCAANGSDKCISGFFTQVLIPTSGVIGGPSLGVTAIELSG